MATREGIDFSGPYPSAEALRAAGRDFVLRYARKTGTKDKNITTAEAAYWKANRVDVGIVEESNAERALAGRAAGAADATAARGAVRSVGGPVDGGVIYMAVDFQPTAAQMPAVLDYLRGAASVLGAARTGVYGSYKVCQAAQAAGICRYLWQTYAWSGGLVLAGIHLYQYSNSHTLGGVDVDYCRTSVADWGQWPTTAQEDLSIVDAATRTYLDAKFAEIQGDFATVVTKIQTTGARLAEFQAALSDDEADVTAAIAGAKLELLDVIRQGQTGDLAAEEVAQRAVGIIVERISDDGSAA